MNSDKGQAITVHGSAIYIGGRYGPQSSQDSVRFADTVFRDTASPFVGRSDMFVSKFDTAGNFQWIRPNHVQDFGDGSQYMSLDTDAQGNVYCAANSKRQTFPGTGYNALGFLAKYDPHGNLLRVSEVVDFQGAGNGATLRTLGVDGIGNAYLGGNLNNTVQVGGAQGVQLTGNMGRAFLAKFDTLGNFSWVTQSYATGSSGMGGVKIVSVNSNEVIYATGGFQHFMTWGGSDSLIRQSESRPFIYIFDTAGNDLRSAAPESIVSNGGGATDIDISNSFISITSQIRGPLTWGSHTDSSRIGLSDPVLYVLDTALNVQSINVLPTVGDEQGNLMATAFDQNQNLYVTGHVGGDVQLPIDTAHYQGGSTDALLAKFGVPCAITTIRDERPRLSEGKGISAYPNPTDGPVRIVHGQTVKDGTLAVHDMQGRLLLERQLRRNAESSELDLSGRSAGLYLVSVTTDSGRWSVKVVVR